MLKKENLLLIAGIGCMAVAIAMIGGTIISYSKAAKTYETIKEEFCTSVTIEQTKEEEHTETEELTEDYKYVQIDFESLQKLNKDIIGWIRFDNIETIDYPILYSGDNETYLKTDLYGRTSPSGCIFLEGANTPDFEDYHTIIYGHNMKDRSMFGKLNNYKTEDFYDDHAYFTIYTKEHTYRYQIFAYRDVPETDSVYTIGFMPDEIYQNFLNEMVKKSYIDTGVTVTKEDKIITLSTCSSEGYRFIVQAVCIDKIRK